MRAKTLLALSALAVLCGPVLAQTARQANEQRCQQLAQEVNIEFQQAVQSRMPKEDPATYNQNGYDVKGILMQDSSAGLWKLAQLNFTNIMNNLVNRGLAQTTARAQQTFSGNMNGILAEVGIRPVAFQQRVSSAVDSATSSLRAAPLSAAPPAQSKPTAASPYAR